MDRQVIAPSESKDESAARGQPFAALAVAAAFFALMPVLPDSDALGRPLPLSLLLGGAFGVLLQRSRFCFFCMARDFIDRRDPRGLLGIVVALAVGLLGTYAVFGAWLPQPSGGRLPPDAHIGPVSWVLALGAFTFGVGMAVSGSCISAHLYRLGEGSTVAPVALMGAAAGFGLGFLSWNTLYLGAVQEAPIVWLPRTFGYGGSLALQLAVLALLAFWLMRHRAPAERTADSLFDAVLRRRWPAYLGGALIGALATVAYLRVGPLGVTAELGSLSRTAADGLGLLLARLEGLDSLAGCATAVKQALVSRNGVFVVGLILGAFAAALAAGEFRPRLPTAPEIARGLAGGVLLGWGAMVSLGCTVGVLLSGITAGAASGWMFAVFCFAGVWAGWRLRQRLDATSHIGT
ncbi:MAG: YeeE/YedE family protein [Reyranella sp.]|nr:YeeE/YedE family protein [Reyranella sp.]